MEISQEKVGTSRSDDRVKNKGNHFTCVNSMSDPIACPVNACRVGERKRERQRSGKMCLLALPVILKMREDHLRLGWTKRLSYECKGAPMTHVRAKGI